MTKEQVSIVAAQWWANKLKAKEPHSNGDSGLSSIFACFLADSGMKDVPHEAYDIFVKELSERIANDIEMIIERGKFSSTWFGCDYDPCAILCESAEIAGISKFNFPYKTDMRVIKEADGDYKIMVSAGYAAPWTKVTENMV